MELASERKHVTCKAWPWERLKENSQLQLSLWPSRWVQLTPVFCIAHSGEVWGWSVSSVTVSTTGFQNLNLAYQIHLIHWKLGLDSAGRTRCMTTRSSALLMFLDLSFHHVLWFMCMLWPKEKVLSPALKMVMYTLNFTNPNISIESISIILLSTCSHAVKIESWKFTAVDRLQQKRV